MSARVIAALLILAAYSVPEDPSLAYMNAVVEICANIYGLDADDCRCIVNRESEWSPTARGDNGKAVGLWQWHEESIRTAFRDMGVEWDWKEDPRLNVWASTLAACHAISQGWRWWATQSSCEGALGR